MIEPAMHHLAEEGVCLGMTKNHRRITLCMKDGDTFCLCDMALALRHDAPPRPHCPTRLVPDFTMNHWKEVGLTNFTELVDELRELSELPAETKKCGWVGDAEQHALRRELVEKAKSYPDVIEALTPVYGAW